MKLLYVLVGVVVMVWAQEPGCTRYNIPDGFYLSTATSAYQVEGGAFEDGKGPSMWDYWTQNRVLARDSGNVTCDSYHKYKEDVQILKNMGLKRYRFSIAWTRLFPDGSTDNINPAGVQYYNNLINELIANGITPMVTMYHWDLPEVLNNKGGWLNRDIVDAFGNYARALYGLFGDRVKWWFTLNEPIITATYGYCGRPTISAPGNFSIACPWSKYLAGHHEILAHAKAYSIYNNEFRFWQRGQVGIVLATGWYESQDPSNPEDVAAAERARAFALEWWAHPIFKGDYPPLMKQYIAARSAQDGNVRSRLPEFTTSDKILLKGGLFGKGRAADFLGINYYYSFNVTKRTDFPLVPAIPLEEYDGAIIRKLISPHPTGIRRVLNFASQTYNVPVMITENGLSVPVAQDSLDDQNRITYIKNHLVEVLKAVQEGSNVIGYTVWSIMDNLEWSSGFTSKFGLYHVDFTDPERKRTPKASAAWYKQVVAQRYVDICVSELLQEGADQMDQI